MQCNNHKNCNVETEATAMTGGAEIFGWKSVERLEVNVYLDRLGAKQTLGQLFFD